LRRTDGLWRSGFWEEVEEEFEDGGEVEEIGICTDEDAQTLQLSNRHQIGCEE